MLINNGNKYLAHILVKGMKGNFEMILNWLRDVFSHSLRIAALLIEDEASIPAFMQTIKPGLISKEIDVAS